MVSSTAEGSTQTKMPAPKPKDEDYSLSGVRIRQAENGVVVSCDYSMDQSTKDKYRGRGCYDTYREPKDYVFDSHTKAAEFITKEIGKLK
jgi:hypothetical protein